MKNGEILTESKNFKNEELLLYVTSKLKDCPNFGSVLLNKVLYYIDNIHYLKHGTPVSSFSYIKQELGPTPDPHVFLLVREKMIKEGKLCVENVEKYGKIQKRLVAMKNPRIEMFSPSEIELIDMVIGDCRDFTASQISNFSHREMAWKLATLFEELPLFTYLLTQSEITEDDITWGRDKISSFRTVSSN